MTAAAQKIVFSICFLAVLLLAAFSIFTADDSYILLRYAENFVKYGELSFNHGERINALTSPLHAIITIILFFLSGGYILHTGKLLMCILLFASVFLIAKPYKKYPYLYILPFAVLLLSPFVLMWTVGGLETILLLFLITWLCTESMAAATPGQLYKLCIIAGLAFLTRFDSVLFTAPFLVIYYYFRFSIIKSICTFFLAIILYVILPVFWLTFALFYFHDPLPTSFYHKLSRTFNFDTVVYCLRFFLYMGFIPFYGLGILLLYRNNNLKYFTAHFKRYAHIHLALLVITLYGFTNAQAHMMFGHRMLLPYSAALILIMLDVLKEIYKREAGKAFSGKGIYVVLLGLFAGFQLFHCAYVYFKSVNGITNSGEYRQLSLHAYKHNFLQVMEDGAKDLQKHILTQPKFKNKPPTFVTFAEGVIPYRIPDLYTYGQLVSLRKNDVVFDYYLIKNSDYTHLTSPEQQVFIDSILQIPDTYKVISKHIFPFNGKKTTFYIFYNTAPEYIKLTKYIRNKPEDFFTSAFDKISGKNIGTQP